ncbi:MAG TPA: adenylate/guanylate cyclase domain-containing protein [Gaiellaceae bacterium]
MVTCAACGGELPDQFRFCGYCGVPLQAAEARGPGHESRRSVTVVFSDLKGSTAMGERLDSEALREVMTRYFDEMSAALERHGGTVEKFIGDAIMAVFGMPVAHEDDALRAVRAALEMKERLAVLNVELEERWNVTLANRTGVNTGPVISSGDASSRQRLVTGDTVNVAARLEQAAPAYEVLIGESTYRLVRGAVEVEAVEPLELKGKSERVPAYRLVSVSEIGGPARRHDIPLVGRGAELAELAGALEVATQSRSCRLVTVVADAGTGKSRLIAELSELAAGRGGLVTRGRCLPYGRGITFWPLVEIVTQVAGITEEDGPEQARERVAALADDEAVVDRVAAAIGLSDAEFPLEELYWGARKLLEGLAVHRPVVAIFEDLHWAETALLDLVTHLASRAESAPILLLCATRPDLAERHPDWPDVPGAQRIELAPLSDADVGAMVEELLGGALPAEIRARVVDAAGGNPLFVEQLVNMLLEDGTIHRDGDEWRVEGGSTGSVAIPASIEALLAARLDLLPDDELTVLESASVIGQMFQRPPLEEIAPERARPIGGSLERIAGKQLVRSLGADQPDSFRFHHVMVKDSAYNRLPKRARSELHAAFAVWAKRVNRDRDRELEFQEIVGFHLEQACRYLSELGPLGEVGEDLGRRAAAELAPAGRRAFGRGDMWAASSLLARAAVLLPVGSPERLALLPDLGESLMEIGEFGQAEAHLDEAVTGSTRLGDATLVADSVLTRLLVAHHTVQDLDAWRAEVQDVAGRLIPILERGDSPAVLAKAWRMVAFVHGTACRWEATANALEHAIRNAREAGADRQLARLSGSYVMALAEGGTPAPEAIERAEAVLADGLADRQAEAVALLSLAPLHAMSGDFDRARALTGRARELLRDLGGTVLAARTSDASSRVELMAGDGEAAEAALRADYDTLSAMDERYFRPNIGALLAKTLFELGRIEDAEAVADVVDEISSPDDVEAQAQLKSVRSRILTARGQYEEGQSLAREALDLLGDTDAPVLRADTLVDVAGVFAAVPAERSAVLEEARALYSRKRHLIGLARVEAELAAPVG